MRTSIFAFFFGLGASGAAFVLIGLPAFAALQAVVLLAAFTLALAAVVGYATGEFRRDVGA